MLDESRRRRDNDRENDCEEQPFTTHLEKTNFPYTINQDLSEDSNVSELSIPAILEDLSIQRRENRSCWFVETEMSKCEYLERFVCDSMSPDQCRTRCLENRLCHTARLFSGFSISSSTESGVCFLFTLGARECQLNDSEIFNHLDANRKLHNDYIQCTKPRCLNDDASCLDLTSPETSWYQPFCDYNWRFDEGFYNYACESCEFFVEPEDCKNSLSCLRKCFGINSLIDLTSILSQRARPEEFNLPSEYLFVYSSWGSFFYKYHGDHMMSRTDAQKLCHQENAELATPLSIDENKFIATLGLRDKWSILNKNHEIWLGFRESELTTEDGNDVSWINLQGLQRGVVMSHDSKLFFRDSSQNAFVFCWKIHNRY